MENVRSVENVSGKITRLQKRDGAVVFELNGSFRAGTRDPNVGAVLESAMQKVHDILEQCVECHAA